MRQCAQKGCRNEAQPNMFSCATCVPYNPLTLPAEEGTIWIEFAYLLRNRFDLLLDFVKENELLGVLDKRYALQWLTDLDRMRVTKLKLKVANRKVSEKWGLHVVVDSMGEFKGEGPTFEDAIISLCMHIEQCAAS